MALTALQVVQLFKLAASPICSNIGEADRPNINLNDFGIGIFVYTAT